MFLRRFIQLVPHNRLQYSAFSSIPHVHSLPKVCPSCSQPLPSALPACNNCWSIFALPPGTTHHELFDLPYEPNPFDVDLPTLKQRFRKAQALCHPDSWTSKGSNKQDIAQALSARLNGAYQTLLRPLSRAEYILTRNELPLSESDQVDDMEFMAEIMEARETIEDSEDRNEVLLLAEENEDKIRENLQTLRTFVGKQDWAGAKEATIRQRYLEGIERAAKRWMDNN